MFSSVLQAETTAFPQDGWQPTGSVLPSLYLREAWQSIEIAGVAALSGGEYGVAHGRVLFGGCSVDSAYMRYVAKATFEQEIYWRHCLLPHKFTSPDEAKRYLLQVTGQQEVNHETHFIQTQDKMHLYAGVRRD